MSGPGEEGRRRGRQIAMTARSAAAVLSSALILLAVTPALAGTSKPLVTEKMRQEMEKGWVMEYQEKDAAKGVAQWTAMGIVDDVPEAVLYVLISFDKYKHFIDRMKNTRIIKRKGYDLFVVAETKLPWPVKDAWVYFKVTRTHLPGRVYELKFEKINGTMKQYTGWARVEPWSEDGKRTLLTYSLKFEPETGAPVAVIDKGVWSVAIHVVKRIRLRLKALRKFNKVPKAWGGSS